MFDGDFCIFIYSLVGGRSNECNTRTTLFREIGRNTDLRTTVFGSRHPTDREQRHTDSNFGHEIHLLATRTLAGRAALAVGAAGAKESLASARLAGRAANLAGTTRTLAAAGSALAVGTARAVLVPAGSQIAFAGGGRAAHKGFLCRNGCKTGFLDGGDECLFHALAVVRTALARSILVLGAQTGDLVGGRLDFGRLLGETDRDGGNTLDGLERAFDGARAAAADHGRGDFQVVGRHGGDVGTKRCRRSQQSGWQKTFAHCW